MKFGLTERQLREVLDILSRFEDVESCILFGSRTTEHYQRASDIDLALKGSKGAHLTRSSLTLIRMAFEDSSLPLFVDVLDYHDLSDADFCKKQIDRCGILIYPAAT